MLKETWISVAVLTGILSIHCPHIASVPVWEGEVGGTLRPYTCMQNIGHSALANHAESCIISDCCSQIAKPGDIDNIWFILIWKYPDMLVGINFLD